VSGGRGPAGPPLHLATVAAVATAPGRGAVALLRVSGPDAFAVVARVARPWPLPPRRATLCALRDGDGRLLDRALVTAFPGPASYTGEDVVELATHGGGVVPASVLAALVAAGAEAAAPGEFTRRAVLNGRLDLVQAEAVGDLVDARSGAMQAAALAQLDGGLSRRVAALRDALLEVEALLAYDIDFPEEDAGPLARERVSAAAGRVRDQLAALLATAPAGAVVRDGATVVIAGAPNAGKSSLFNALLGERRAIVTDVAGTTRDAVDAILDARPWPLRLVDTAGLRATADVVERLGIEVSERWLASASVVLACGETPAGVAATAARVRTLTAAPVVEVWTKRDGADPPLGASPPLEVSAESGRGLRELVEAVQEVLGARLAAPPADLPLVTRARHQRALGEARDEVAAFLAAWEEGALPAPVAAVHVRAAVGALDDLIGTVDVEEILGRLFATFCVGK
jgi:tRNA modification GTPase